MAPRRHSYKGIPIALSTDGLWHAKMNVGHKPNGQLDRRHRSGATPEEVKAKLRKLEADIAEAGRVPAAGRAKTVQEWFTVWLSDIAPHGRRALAPSTLAGYRSKCRNWVFPHLGQLRLDGLEPDNLDALYRAMREAGKAEAHILQVHAIIRRGLGVARQRRMIARNVATEMDPPAVARPHRTPLPTKTAIAVVNAARHRRNAARWLLGLSIGCRQGEALGLLWPCVNLDEGTVRIEWQLQRLPWLHGCKDPHACGERYHRTEPCPPANRGPRKGKCAVHLGAKGCPPPCGRRCDKHASKCKSRRGGGLVLRRPKRWREDQAVVEIALAPQVVEALRELQAKQRAERRAAGTAWRRTPHPEGGIADFVFRQVDGAPLDPRRDWGELQDILDEAGLPRARVHSMRHTAATLALELGVDIAVVQEILGHAQIQTTRGYTTVRTTATKVAADRIGGALFGADVTDLVTERQRRRSS